jgi:transposase
MNKASSTLPDDPILLKQLLMSASVQMSEKDGQIEHLREQIALLTQRLFGRKPEQTFDPDSPQLEIFNETESHAEATPEAQVDEVEEEVVAPVKRRGKRKPLPAELPRVEIIHGLPGHELTCACGCRKQVIGEEISNCCIQYRQKNCLRLA